MRNFVITMSENSMSQCSALKCIESGKKHGIDIKQFRAITPADDPEKTAKELNIPTENFKKDAR